MLKAAISWIIADEVVLKVIGLVVGGAALLALIISVGIQAGKMVWMGTRYLVAKFLLWRMGEYDRKHK